MKVAVVVEITGEDQYLARQTPYFAVVDGSKLHLAVYDPTKWYLKEVIKKGAQ